MGFKITHPLLPSRLLVWPPWHTSAWRLHVPPDRMSGTSDTTKWPQCLHFHFVLVVFLISSPFSPFPFFFKVDVLFFSHVSRWLANRVFSLSSSVCIQLFIFMLLSVYWFLSVFECHYTCGQRGYRSWGVFCLSSPWIDFTPLEHMHSADW